MKRLTEYQDEITSSFNNKNGVVMFLDFDGTLSPIIADYRKATIDPEVRVALEKAAINKRINITVISGRHLSDLKARVAIPNINFSGTHGLEWEINGRYNRYEIDQKILNSLTDAKNLLKDIKNIYPGIEVEEKEISLAVHYRLLEDSTVNEFKKHFFDVFADTEISRYLKFIEGKRVIDLRPNVDWNKGSSAKMIADSFKDYLAIAVGDDTTDEDLFKVFPEGLTIRVGLDERSNAKYYVDDVKGVARFISQVNKMASTQASMSL